MENIKKTLSAVAFLLAVITTPTLAEEHQTGSGPSPFSDCGIGAELFPNNSVAAVLSNVIWDAGTTALISATTSPETCKGREVVAARFIHETYANIIEETSKGQGSHLSAMLDIFQCSPNSHAEIIHSVRSEIGYKIQSDGYHLIEQIEKSKDYYQVVYSKVNSSYVDHCSA